MFSSGPSGAHWRKLRTTFRFLPTFSWNSACLIKFKTLTCAVFMCKTKLRYGVLNEVSIDTNI